MENHNEELASGMRHTLKKMYINIGMLSSGLEATAECLVLESERIAKDVEQQLDVEIRIRKCQHFMNQLLSETVERHKLMHAALELRAILEANGELANTDEWRDANNVVL